MASLPPLRLLTCGSVDDGKSTLIGRLLHESENIFEDQARSLAKESEAHGTAPGQLDFALLLDGLMAEREQGITIDVAYRYFSTPRRAFIVADTPGHEQYTRNMATGSSTADLAILLVDARKGLLPQTHRHARIVAMMGIRHVVLAVNKMDLVGFDRAVFEDIHTAFLRFSQTLKFRTVQAIPLSALHGDNLLAPGGRTPWYSGPCLLDYLETVDVTDPGSSQPFRMPIQLVLRPNQDFRGLAGRIAQGILRPGDPVMVQPSGRKALVREIVTPNGPLESACAGQSVTLTLDCDVDAGRGDVLADAERPCDMSAHFRRGCFGCPTSPWFRAAPTW